MNNFNLGSYPMTLETLRPMKEEKMSDDFNVAIEQESASRDHWSVAYQQAQSLFGIQQAAAQAYAQYQQPIVAQRDMSGIAQRTAHLTNDSETRCALSRAYNAETQLAALRAEIAVLHDALKVRTDERDALRAAEEKGNHDYNGPVDTDGRTVPDPVHERVHEVVGDILAGRIIAPARRQLQDALGKAPKDKTPFPVRASIPFLEKGVRL